jgi:hypothetical protein
MSSKNRNFAKLASDVTDAGQISAAGLEAGAGLDSAEVITLIGENASSGGLDSAAVLSLTTGSIIAYNTILSGDD